MGVKELNRKNEGAFCLAFAAVAVVAALEVDHLGAFFEGVSNVQIGQIRHVVGIPDVKAWPEICKQAHDEPNPLKILFGRGPVHPVELLAFVL
jgi:hypothetical protein